MRLLDSSLRAALYAPVGVVLIFATIAIAATGALRVSGSGLVLWMSCGALLTTLAFSGRRDGPPLSDAQHGTPAELLALASTIAALIISLLYADATSTLVLAAAALTIALATSVVAADGAERDRSRRLATRRMAGLRRRVIARLGQ